MADIVRLREKIKLRLSSLDFFRKFENVTKVVAIEIPSYKRSSEASIISILDAFVSHLNQRKFSQEVQ